MRRAPLVALVAVAAAAAFVVSQLPAGAITVTGTPTPVTGNSTYFDGLGQPYGGCGLPQANLDSQDFVALNVFNTPGDYAFSTRPVPASMADKIGMWDNGLNCGRYVQVTISDFCTGTNDGAPGQPFCRNGSYVPDQFNGATLTMLVADSCGDSNAWCRDDPYHLDLHKDSLSRFVLNGSTVNLLPDHFNNRHITWQFVPAPNYSGDINIGFLQGAQVWWPAISVSHLANGVHSVEYMANGVWTAAPNDGDMGQAFIIGGTTSGANQFQIRVRDANDQLINGGRVYSFTLPSACSSQCSAPYTQTTYTTDGGSTASPTASPTPTRSPSVSPTPTRSPSVSPTPTRSPSVSPTPSSTGGSGGCALSATVDSSWQGGYQTTITVKNNGTTASTGWSTKFSFAGTQTVGQAWNATVTQSGAAVTATNVSYNGSLSPGGSTTFGMIVNGTNQPLATPSCSLS